MAKFSVVVVGAGLAGLSAAYSLAKDGVDVLVVERGDYPGAKNVTGGRLYLAPVKNLFPELWSEAPFERHVVRETIVCMSEHSSTSMSLATQKFNEQPYNSFTILRSKFDRWFSEKATEVGARIISKYKVDDLVLEEGKVRGIKVGQDQIDADVVVAADGAISVIAEKAGLKTGGNQPADFALGVKEVVQLGADTIQDRFGLEDDEGAAQLFVGSLTRGMFGGGFLYTAHDCVSLGLVIKIKELMENELRLEPYRLLEDFKQRPELMPLLKGGQSVEYSAHLVSEAGIKAMPRLFGDGILVVGDAAGLVTNLGLMVRGMDFAIASGALAAKAIKEAREQNDFAASSLSRYQELLKESFVWKDLHTFKHAPQVLDNPRVYRLYPQMICDLFEDFMSVGEHPKRRLFATAFGRLKGKLALSLVKDVMSVRRM